MKLHAFIEKVATRDWSESQEVYPWGKVLFHKTPGVIEIIPHSSIQEKIAISVGVHGNETAPIEIAWEIIQLIQKGEISPCVNTLILFAHAPSMLAAKRFIDFNLNRLFNGNHKKYPEAMESPRAQELEVALLEFFNDPTRSMWHLDLHTAIRGSHHERFVVRPYYKDNRPISEEELQVCASMGVEAILKTRKPATTYSGFSAESIGANSFTVELGKVELFGENDLSRFEMTKSTLIKILENGVQTLKSSHPVPIIYDVTKELINDHDKYKFFIAEDYLNFTPLQEGEVIEQNKEGLLKAKEGQSIVFPNPNVPQGQRTGLLVEPQ